MEEGLTPRVQLFLILNSDFLLGIGSQFSDFSVPG